jgi:hypothetical protein
MRTIFDEHVPASLREQFNAGMQRRVCLIVNERSLNCPSNVAPPLHGALHSERAAIDDDVRECFAVARVVEFAHARSRLRPSISCSWRLRTAR